MPGIRRRSLALTVTLGLLAGMIPAAASAAPPSPGAAFIAHGLSIPWDVAFVPDGTMLVTERAGRVRVYASGSPNAALVRTVQIPGMRAEGEAGLMGIAVDVDFASNRYVYVCASRQYSGSNGWVNEVLRYRIDTNGNWQNGTVLPIGRMEAANIHDGCALEMDRFGMLWVTMGDANVTSRAQDRNSLNGKVLRVNRDGTVPGDNPVISGIRNAVYSMGHRNPQGIAFRPGTDQVYVVEHGPQPAHGDDEVNLIFPGANYGWPCYTGFGRPYLPSGCAPASSYQNPAWTSGAGVTLATSGGAFVRGTQWGDWAGQLFVSMLKESEIRRFAVNGDGTLTHQQTLYDNHWGRLRASVVGPGGHLYVTTSNGGDDKVIRISAVASSLDRIAGADRYATAAALSQSAYAGGATNVMVATGTNFPDALAGSAAAARHTMPVLLVGPNSIPAATKAELNRLKPQTIFLLGGTGAVSEAVRAELVGYAATGNVERLSGADRYGTAAAISNRFFGVGPPAAFVATGAGFADALAGAPAAAVNSAPLLLVGTNSIPASTHAELQRLNPGQIFVLGGPGVVSPAVAAQLDGYTAGPVTRLSGADRYGTNAAIVRAFWSTSTHGFVASGANFPDALAGGAVAGRDRLPLILTQPTYVPLHSGQEILRLAANRLIILGGGGAVAGSAEAQLRALAGTP
jgi:glucose/arabinose dehydrogenase